MSTSQNPEEYVREKVRQTVEQGEEIQEQVTEIAAEQAQEFHRSGKGLLALVNSAIEGAVEAVNRSVPEDKESVLRQVVDALGDGLSQAALAARLALEEAQSRNKQFAEEDLERIREDFSNLNKSFVETIDQAQKKIREETSSQVSGFSEHAKQTFSRMGPAVQSTLDAVSQHPIEFTKQTAAAGAETAKFALGSLFSEIGDRLREAGDRLRGEPGQS